MLRVFWRIWAMRVELLEWVLRPVAMQVLYKCDSAGKGRLSL